MKRSEMYKILEELLEDNCYGEYLPQVSTLGLLAGLEKAGMLPPPYEACVLTRLPKKRGEMLIYDWEPEDEKK